MTVAPMPPLSGPTGEDGDRIRYTRGVRRALYGQHEADVRERISTLLRSVERVEAWGDPDLSSNPLKVVWTSLSTLYRRSPVVTVAADGLIDAAQELAAIATAAGLWQLMGRVQRDTLTLREHWLRVDVAERPGGTGWDPVYEAVPPDLTIAVDTPDRPGIPVGMYHARLRRLKNDSEDTWCWDYLDVSDPDQPVYRVLRPGTPDPEDVTSRTAVTGWPDHWRDRAGRPVLPYVLYHAARTPHLWDPYATLELYEGTLNICVLRTFLLHVIRGCAWRQRYGINVRVPGLSVLDDTDGNQRVRTGVPMDPGILLMFENADDAQGTGTVGTLDAPMDPRELSEVIETYERQVMAGAGINPADQLRMSGDPRSGYALAISRDSQREAQRQYEPQFRAGDQEVLRLTAIMLNRKANASYPEFGYRVAYQGIPQSSEERTAQREHLIALMGVGLIDPVSAYQELHPGTSDADAMAALEQIAELRARFAAAPTAPAVAPSDTPR